MNDPKQTEEEYYEEKFHDTFPSENRTLEDDEWEKNNPDTQYIPDDEEDDGVSDYDPFTDGFDEDSGSENDDWESTWYCG